MLLDFNLSLPLARPTCPAGHFCAVIYGCVFHFAKLVFCIQIRTVLCQENGFSRAQSGKMWMCEINLAAVHKAAAQTASFMFRFWHFEAQKEREGLLVTKYFNDFSYIWKKKKTPSPGVKGLFVCNISAVREIGQDTEAYTVLYKCSPFSISYSNTVFWCRTALSNSASWSWQDSSLNVTVGVRWRDGGRKENLHP